jgi:hypothetical protein
VLDYFVKRARYSKDMATVQKIMEQRANYLSEVSKEDQVETNINKLINLK